MKLEVYMNIDSYIPNQQLLDIDKSGSVASVCFTANASKIKYVSEVCCKNVYLNIFGLGNYADQQFVIPLTSGDIKTFEEISMTSKMQTYNYSYCPDLISVCLLPFSGTYTIWV